MKLVSVIMPVYMEAANVENAVNNTLWALENAGVQDYEIIIIDCLRQNGTHDGTPVIAERLAANNPRIKVSHNRYMNLGDKYWQGVDRAAFPYLTLVAGDNELAKESVCEILKHLGEADIIISYPENSEVRPFSRRLISKLFVLILNFITGLNLRYYNGMCIHKTLLLRNIRKRNSSFAYMAEVLITLLKKGYSYKEVPFRLQKRKGGKSAAFKLKNVISVSKTVIRLFCQYRLDLNS